MSTTLATRNNFAPHTRVPSRPLGVGSASKATKTKRSEPSPKPKPATAAPVRRKDKPRTDVVFESKGRRAALVPKLVTPEYTPTSSPGPLTPPTPQRGLAASIRSKPSGSSLRPPVDQHTSRTTVLKPRPAYAYTPDVKPVKHKDHGRDTNDVKPDVKPNVDEPAEERIRDLKSLEAFGVRFVQRTDDMRGTQVLARDADFAADVAYLSRVSNLSSSGCKPMARKLSWAALASVMELV